MSTVTSSLRARATSHGGRKLIKYSAVSVVAVVVTFVTQVILLGIFHMGAERATFLASMVAAVPSYFLNRKWVWGKAGRSHLRKEVAPFWIMVVIGTSFAMLVSSLVEGIAQDAGTSHLVRTFLIPCATFATYAVLWVGKYIFFNKILFVHREEELDPVLDGRTGLPT